MFHSLFRSLLGSSNKTSFMGWGALLAAFGSALTAHFDGDPATVPDWGVVAVGVFVGLGLLFARDNNKSSEAVGAKPPN